MAKGPAATATVASSEAAIRETSSRKRKATSDTTKSREQSVTRPSKKQKRPQNPSATKSQGKKPMRPARKNQPRDAERKEAGINQDIARMDPELLADHLGRQVKRFEPKLSMVELEDRRVPGNAFLDTSSWDKERNLAGVPSFLEEFSSRSAEQLRETPNVPGTPHTIVVAASGIRAADLTRAVRTYQSEQVAVLKLFAKHIKLKEAIESTKATKSNVAVGTPQRIFDLIDQGALSIDRLERVAVDASSVNEKQRGILDMPETATALSRLLSRRELKARYQDGLTRLVVY